MSNAKKIIPEIEHDEWEESSHDDNLVHLPPPPSDVVESAPESESAAHLESVEVEEVVSPEELEEEEFYRAYEESAVHYTEQPDHQLDHQEEVIQQAVEEVSQWKEELHDDLSDFRQAGFSLERVVEDIQTLPLQELIRRVEMLLQENKHDEKQWKEAISSLTHKVDEIKRGLNLRSLEHLDQLEKLEYLTQLEELKYLDKLEVMDNLRELQSLDMLLELKSLGQLSSLEELRHLKELSRVDELRTLIEDFSRIVPIETFENILAKQHKELEQLERLDELRKLDNLVKLEDLNYLTFLGKLDHLRELVHLDKLQDLSKLQGLEKLEQMAQLSKLDQLENLGELENLKELENLRQLSKIERLDELEKLESLRFLKELGRLDELDTLRKLEELRGLAELDKIRELSKLDNLARLEKLAELEQLDKLETLKVLQNPKVVSALEKIENLPLFRDKFHIYIMKSLMNSLFDFIKVAGLCVLVVYLVTTHMNRETVAKMLPYLGFGQSHRVNFAMELLADSVPREQFLRYYNYLLKRVDEQASDYFEMPASLALSSQRQVQILDQLYSYNFTDGADGENLKAHVEAVMNKGATNAMKRYEEISGYELEKGLVAKEDRNAMHQASIFMRNRQFAQAIAEFSRMGGLTKYDSVSHGINYSIHELYREDPVLAKRALDEARLVLKGK